jgi:EmrB/QacA subfamily drug resistance transporter
MTTTAERSQSTEAAAPYPRRWLAFVIMMAAAFMDLVDATVVNIALPTLRTDLGATYAQTQWITAGYTLAFGLGLITGGRLGDRFGRKKIFLIGVVAFTTASALCGLAVNPEMLIACRIFQGASSALMMPQIVAFVFATFPVKERGGAMGAYGAITGIATIVGPIMGGLLVTYSVFGLGWRAIFLINIPIGILALIASTLFVPETRAKLALRMDLIGALLITLTLVLVLYPLVQGRESGWPQWMAYAMLASPLVLIVYVLHARRKQRRDGSPLVPLGLFRQPGFAIGIIVILLFDVVLIGYTLALSLSVQLGLDFSAIRSGLVYVPFAIGAGMATSVMDKLIGKMGRHVVSMGGLIMGAGIALTALFVDTETTMWGLWPITFVAGLGLGFVIGTVATFAGAGVRAEDAGAASGTMNAGGQIGAATGAALLAVIFFNVVTGAAGPNVDARDSQVRAELTAAGVPADAQTEILAATRECIVQRMSASDPAVVPVACEQLPPPGTPEGDAVAAAVGKVAGAVKAGSFVDGLHTACWWFAGLSVLLALLAQGLPRKVNYEAALAIH